MGKAIYNKFMASIATAIVLGLLVFAGPAQAFSLKLDFENTEAEQGKKIELTATVDTGSGEALGIESITLVLDGIGDIDSELVECTFDVTGKMKSGVNDACHGINIKKIPYPKIKKGYGYSYGYGYNYGYGITEDLVYEITIHTQKFEAGEYETELRISANGDTFSEPGANIKITEKLKGQEKHEEKEQNQEQETETNNKDKKNGSNGNRASEQENNGNGNKGTEENNEDEQHERESSNEDEQHESEVNEETHENNGKAAENNGNSGNRNSGNGNSNSGNSGNSNTGNSGNGNSGNKGKNK